MVISAWISSPLEQRYEAVKGYVQLQIDINLLLVLIIYHVQAVELTSINK